MQLHVKSGHSVVTFFSQVDCIHHKAWFPALCMQCKVYARNTKQGKLLA